MLMPVRMPRGSLCRAAKAVAVRTHHHSIDPVKTPAMTTQCANKPFGLSGSRPSPANSPMNARNVAGLMIVSPKPVENELQPDPPVAQLERLRPRVSGHRDLALVDHPRADVEENDPADQLEPLLVLVEIPGDQGQAEHGRRGKHHVGHGGAEAGHEADDPPTLQPPPQTHRADRADRNGNRKAGEDGLQETARRRIRHPCRRWLGLPKRRLTARARPL